MRVLHLLHSTTACVVVSALALNAAGQNRNSSDNGKITITPVKRAVNKNTTVTPLETDTTLKDVLEAFRKAGLSVTDVTSEVETSEHERLTEDAKYFGAETMHVLAVEYRTGLVFAWPFEDRQALDLNMSTHKGAIRYGTVLLIPAQCHESTWSKVSSRLTNIGAVRGEFISVAPAVVHSILLTIRGQLELYYAQHGSYPNFAKGGWSILINQEYLLEPPENFLAQCRDKASIALVHEPGKTGIDVDPTVAGWVWNTADHTLFPAGHNNITLAAAVDLLDAHSEAMDQIHTNSGIVKPLDEKFVMAMVRSTLLTMRGLIELFQAVAENEGEARFPTLEELHSNSIFEKMSENPLNNSNTIQAAKWNPDTPPVFGNAGWNYDEQQGKLWANAQDYNVHKQ